ncbi:MAG: ATP-binding protein [Clostridia bacterium]|nr:ATP-binding protein [Clostridia bacterium]
MILGKLNTVVNNLNFPISFYQDNIIYSEDKTVWGCFRVVPFNYTYRSEEEKRNLRNNLARFIANMGQEAKILIVPFCDNIEAHTEHLVSKLDRTDELYEVAKSDLEKTTDYLAGKAKENDNVNDYTTYVIAKLKVTHDLIENFKDTFSYYIKEPIQALKELIGADFKDILEREMKQFKKAALDFCKSQSNRLAVVETVLDETQWLLRRIMFRGIDGDEDLRPDWKPKYEIVTSRGKKAVRPYSKDVLTLAPGVIDSSEIGLLKVKHPRGKTSYQAFLPMSSMPDEFEFPGCEYINDWILESMKFPVEICIHINNVNYQDGVKSIENKRKEYNSQVKHIADANEEPPDDLLKNKEDIDNLENELKASRFPLCRASITVCVSAGTKEKLERRITELRGTLKDNHFILERPWADQHRLFMEFIPGASRYVSDYIIPTTPTALASGIFGATCNVGDREGPYIGTTGMRNVYLDLLDACLKNRSAAAFFWGNLGVGKSFNANLLLYLAVKYCGAKALVIDPKGDRDKWTTHLPEFKGLVRVITLSAKNKGALDPWIMYWNDPEEAATLCLNILVDLLQPDRKEKVCLQEAIGKIKESEKRGMIPLAELLSNWPKEDTMLYETALLLGRQIMNFRKVGLASLMFGEGNEQGLSFDNRINILQVQNMKLPDKETPRDQYTEENIVSKVLMTPISHFTKKFAMSNPGQPTMNIVDEFWSMEGQGIFEYLARTGRSLYTSTIFIGHSAGDIKATGIRNAISYKFCFQITDGDEAKRSLEFLGLEVTKENIEMLQKLKNRECIFSDLYGRIAKIQFDCVFPHLQEAFKTTPKKEKKEDPENEDVA